MKKLDMYLSLCTEVYELSKPTPPKDAYDFYRNYVVQAQGLILEPMCGTGRFLLSLLEERFDVRGFDASENMLEKLHAKAKAKNLEPIVWKVFVEDLESPEKYNLIFIPNGSFGLIVDPEKVERVLKVFYNHLEDGGILLFEAETLSAVSKLNAWGGSVWHKPDGQMIILSHLEILNSNVCTSIGKYKLVDYNSIIHTEIEELKMRLYDPQELIAILRNCGFKNIRTIKAFDSKAEPHKNDEVVVYECRK